MTQSYGRSIVLLLIVRTGRHCREGTQTEYWGHRWMFSRSELHRVGRSLHDGGPVVSSDGEEDFLSSCLPNSSGPSSFLRPPAWRLISAGGPNRGSQRQYVTNSPAGTKSVRSMLGIRRTRGDDLWMAMVRKRVSVWREIGHPSTSHDMQR